MADPDLERERFAELLAELGPAVRQATELAEPLIKDLASLVTRYQAHTPAVSIAYALGQIQALWIAKILESHPGLAGLLRGLLEGQIVAIEHSLAMTIPTPGEPRH
jgi:hypothetical protein